MNQCLSIFSCWCLLGQTNESVSSNLRTMIEDQIIEPTTFNCLMMGANLGDQNSVFQSYCGSTEWPFWGILIPGAGYKAKLVLSSSCDGFDRSDQPYLSGNTISLQSVCVKKQEREKKKETCTVIDLDIL